MRVCLFSKYGQSSNFLYEGTRTGLKENNVPFIEININKLQHEDSPHWLSIPTLKSQPPHEEDKSIIETIQTFRADIIILLQYSGLQFLTNHGSTLRSILGTKGKIAFWNVDLEPQINSNTDVGQFIDYFFLSNGDQLEEFKQKWGINHTVFMPQGCFVQTDMAVNEPHWEIGFLGRRQKNDPRYNERNTILDAFKTEFDMIEADNITTVDQSFNFYHDCQINLGLSWRNDVYLYSSDRLFNVLGAGGFYLCQYFPGIERLVENHKHLIWFMDVEEGKRLVHHYLFHPQERNKIARQGYDLAKEKHSYSKRIKNILDIIEEKSSDFFGYLS